MSSKNDQNKAALNYHAFPIPGKIATYLPKQLNTIKDLALAYSPGVAIPCEEIAKDQNKAYEYTNKGNTVAVITNGTAVLGLGNIGAIAAKPVMEGKSALLKKFANIDSFDIIVDTENVDEFISTVAAIGSTFGAINLEDIKAPDCFIIEEALQNRLDIPIFHDDQHGTAITLCSALLSALEIQKKNLEDVNVVVSGAGAGAIASINLLIDLGMDLSKLKVFDSKGMISIERKEEVNKWKTKFANHSSVSLSEAMKGADVFIGLSVKDVLSSDMVASMATNPVIFAIANPHPEILPEAVWAVRNDAIIATGRSDYPNQVNNLVAFPYIFRGLLDARANTVTTKMKISVVNAIKNLTKLPVPESIKKIHNRQDMTFGKDYIIPSPFDSRLLETIPKAVVDSIR